MRNALAGTWLYAIMIIFMVILIAYVAITINYSRAFEMSENVIKILEQYEGFNSKSRDLINGALNTTNSTAKHSCGEFNYHGDKQLYYGVTGTSVDKNPRGKNYDYCISRINTDVNGVKKYFYLTKVYFPFKLPVLGEIYSFEIPGETSALHYIYDDSFSS